MVGRRPRMVSADATIMVRVSAGIRPWAITGPIKGSTDSSDMATSASTNSAASAMGWARKVIKASLSH